MDEVKPYAEACDRNRGPILEVLRRHFGDRSRVLEIGSGTGQHAVHFAAALPQLEWQTSDLEPSLPGMRVWIEEAARPNLPPPLALDVRRGPWPRDPFDAVFTANTLHIMSWDDVRALFAALPRVLAHEGVLAVYGPFNYHGRFTSASNEAFDGWLKARSAVSGIRDFEAVDALARSSGLELMEDCAMPANNRTLVWRRKAAADESIAKSTAAIAPLRLVLAFLLAPLLAMSLAPSPALARPSGAAIEGALEVSITGPAVKHWGIPGAAAAFVPDADHSEYARGIRDAANAEELCAALSRAARRDPAIASARADGDGNLEHRSGDEMRLGFRIGIAALAAAARGVVYVCSNPIVAVVGRGNYPDERFTGVAGQRLRWVSPPLTLHPGKEARVSGTASVDASLW